MKKTIYMKVTYAVLALSSTVHAQVFDCSFRADSARRGASNHVTCASNLDATFGAPAKGGPSPHCTSDTVNDMLMDLKVDIQRQTANSTNNPTLSAQGREVLIREYQKDPSSAPDAQSFINIFTRPSADQWRVVSYYRGTFRTSMDPVTGRFDPNLEPFAAHYVTMTSDTETAILQVTGASSQATLFVPKGLGAKTWTELKFGNCRISPK